MSNPNPLKTGGELRCPDGQAVPVNLVSIRRCVLGIFLFSVRQVWIYQMNIEKQYVEGKTIQWSKEKLKNEQNKPETLKVLLNGITIQK